MTINVKRYFKLFSIAFLIAATISAVIIYKNGLSNNQKSAPRLSIEEKAAQGDPNALVAMGQAAKKQKKYDEALEWYLKAADKDHGNAFNELAMMYEDGLGVEKDIQKAMEYYEQGGEKGDAPAYYNLFRIYQWGLSGIEKDFKKSGFYLTKSAELGEGKSQYDLHQYYKEGYGGKPDLQKSHEWLVRAARSGYPQAQNNLAAKYYDARKRHDEASNLFIMAANGGDEVAEKIVENAHEICRNAQSAIKIKHVVDCLISAKRGNASAQNIVGSLYHSGTFLEKNIDKAMLYYFKAANQKNMESISMIVAAYLNDGDVSQDLVKSYAWNLVFHELVLQVNENSKNFLKIKQSLEMTRLLQEKYLGFFEKRKAKKMYKNIMIKIENREKKYD